MRNVNDSFPAQCSPALPLLQLWHRNALTSLMLRWTVADSVYLPGLCIRLGNLQAGNHQSKADYIKYTPLNVTHSFFQPFQKLGLSASICLAVYFWSTGAWSPLKSNSKVTWCNWRTCCKATTYTYWVRHVHTVKLIALTQPGNLKCIQTAQNLLQNGLLGEGW